MSCAKDAVREKHSQVLAAADIGSTPQPPPPQKETTRPKRCLAFLFLCWACVPVKLSQF